jgi:hypothetical protein
MDSSMTDVDRQRDKADEDVDEWKQVFGRLAVADEKLMNMMEQLRNEEQAIDRDTKTAKAGQTQF